MWRQAHEVLLPQPCTDVFAALIRSLAPRRWGIDDIDGDAPPVPRPGRCYTRKTPRSLRTGQVLEVIRPVSITICETLEDPPCRVRLKLRWRIHPLDDGSLLRLTLHYRLNHAASLRHGHWRRELARHARRMFDFVHIELERQHSRPAANSKIR